MSYLTASSKKYHDEFWCEVAKHAVCHGARPTAKKYGVCESTVRGFVKSLKRQQAGNPDVDFIALPQKKRGRLKLLSESIAKEIVTANDRTFLKENGGTIEWCESITKRIGFVKRKATTAKPIIAPGLISEIGHTFYHSIS